MKKKYNQFIIWLKKAITAIKPGYNAVTGASIGLLFITAILFVVYAFRVSIGLNDGWILLFLLTFIIAAILLGFLSRKLLKLINKIPPIYKLAIFISFPLLFIMSFNWMIPAIVFVLASICGAAILVLKRTGFKNLTKAKKQLLF